MNCSYCLGDGFIGDDEDMRNCRHCDGYGVCECDECSCEYGEYLDEPLGWTDVLKTYQVRLFNGFVWLIKEYSEEMAHMTATRIADEKNSPIVDLKALPSWGV